MIDLDHILHRVSRPAQYTGGEWNSIIKAWDSVDIHIALAYPDAYEIGMSNMGMAIIYQILNKKDGVLAERVFAPAVDMAAQMRNEHISLFSLESRRPVADFDIIGFSLNYELTYTNVLQMLDLAGIPVSAQQRNDSFPLIIAGGSCVLNPEPMSDFIDAFVMGEGEDVTHELCETVLKWKHSSTGTKKDLLRRLAKISGIYVPSFYQVTNSSAGGFSSITPLTSEIPEFVERRFVDHLPPPVTDQIVPFVEVTHDRGVVEIQRGCTRGCRFCQASFIYRPVRERPVEEIVEAIDEIIDRCGYEEISLLSLSTSDHSGVVELITAINRKYQGKHLNISLPSLRPDAFSVDLAKKIESKRKSLTFAPEAGTDRLRHVINKGVHSDDLFNAIEIAMGHGWRNFKLYFMIGLPTETDDDINGIIELVSQVRQMKNAEGKKPNIKVNISTFIPKPHTPFQWAKQESIESLVPKHEVLKKGIRRTGSQISWHDPNVSLLEGVMSRGDRRIGQVIKRAWELGCVFDAWSDQFVFGKWEKAFEECAINPDDYTRERSQDEPLPWSHIGSGVSTDYLRKEFSRAMDELETCDCRFEKCNRCGLQLKTERCKNQNGQ